MMRFMANHHMLGFYGFTSVSQVLSAIIASERCFCILRPLRSKAVLRTSTMTAVVVAAFVLVVAPHFLIMTKYRIVCARHPLTNTELWTPVPGDFYLRNRRLIDTLDAAVFGAGLNCLAMAVVMATTAVTAVKLRQAAEWRAGSSSSSSDAAASSSSRELALTRMLVYNSGLFIVCVCPLALFRSVCKIYFFFFFFFLVHVVVSMGIYPVGNSCRFPSQESQLNCKRVALPNPN